MYSTTALFGLVASAAVASAAKVTFWTLDDVQRTIYFTPSPGHVDIAPIVVNNQAQVDVEFPDFYEGNYYAVHDGAENIPGMLGEVMFGGWEGMTYFDVSAIVRPDDMNNVKQMWPAVGINPMSGCEVFPCDNAYYHPDDVQTKVTKENHIMQSLGEGSTGIVFE